MLTHVARQASVENGLMFDANMHYAHGCPGDSGAMKFVCDQQVSRGQFGSRLLCSATSNVLRKTISNSEIRIILITAKPIDSLI